MVQCASLALNESLCGSLEIVLVVGRGLASRSRRGSFQVEVSQRYAVEVTQSAVLQWSARIDADVVWPYPCVQKWLLTPLCGRRIGIGGVGHSCWDSNTCRPIYNNGAVTGRRQALYTIMFGT